MKMPSANAFEERRSMTRTTRMPHPRNKSDGSARWLPRQPATKRTSVVGSLLVSSKS